MKKRLILHIGMHKTGSSAIQRFLSLNRYPLRLFGVYYPRSFGADGRRQPKHNALFSAIGHEADCGAPHPALGPSADLVERMAARIERASCRVAILSAEGFSGERPIFARALAPLAARFDVRVVVFLRRPDLWVESFYRQMVMSREVREARSFAAFVEAPETRRHLDYGLILGWWRAAFDDVRVLPFAPELGAPPPVPAFIGAAGLPWLVRTLPFGRGVVNPSPPDEAVEVARLANMRGADAKYRNRKLYVSGMRETHSGFFDSNRRRRFRETESESFRTFDEICRMNGVRVDAGPSEAGATRHGGGGW